MIESLNQIIKKLKQKGLRASGNEITEGLVLKITDITHDKELEVVHSVLLTLKDSVGYKWWSYKYDKFSGVLEGKFEPLNYKPSPSTPKCNSEEAAIRASMEYAKTNTYGSPHHPAKRDHMARDSRGEYFLPPYLR